MANQVYANGMEIACKAAAGKVIAAFPDVCMTPPECPATPPGVPVPYPNNAFASDTSGGSKSVKISDKEIMLKNKSFFKTSTGDEAGATAKKGVISSKTKGKVYFIKWSSNVKVEGENVDRHFDMTTNNHASPAANEALPWMYVDAMATLKGSKCEADRKKIEDNCQEDGSDQCPGALSAPVESGQKDWVRVQKKSAGWKAKEQGLSQATKDAMAHHKSSVRKDESATKNAAKMASEDASGNECVKAMRCFLRPKNPKTGEAGCCPGQTPNHIPPETYFEGRTSAQYDAALCVCLEGMNQHVGTHSDNHATIDFLAETHDLKDKKGKSKGTLAQQNPAKLNDAITVSAMAVAQDCDCNKECIEEQLTKHYESNKQNMPPETTNVTYKKVASRANIDAKKSKTR